MSPEESPKTTQECSIASPPWWPPRNNTKGYPEGALGVSPEVSPWDALRSALGRQSLTCVAKSTLGEHWPSSGIMTKGRKSPTMDRAVNTRLQ